MHKSTGIDRVQKHKVVRMFEFLRAASCKSSQFKITSCIEIFSSVKIESFNHNFAAFNNLLVSSSKNRTSTIV